MPEDTFIKGRHKSGPGAGNDAVPWLPQSGVPKDRCRMTSQLSRGSGGGVLRGSAETANVPSVPLDNYLPALGKLQS